MADYEIAIEEDPKVNEPEIIISDAPAADATKALAPEEGLETLRAKLATEQAAHAETARREQENARAAIQAKNEVRDTNLSLVTNVIDSINQSNAVLKSNYSAALANQDYDAAAEYQFQMTQNAAQLAQLESGKEAIEAQPKAQLPPPRQGDPAEAMADTMVQNGSPRSAAWIRSHPEYARDPSKTQRMLAAHNLAIGFNLQPDTDAYFAHVERSLEINQPAHNEMDDAMTDSAKQTGGRNVAPPAAAPVSRSGAAPGVNRRTVTLTAAQKEAAEISGVSLQEYAANLLAIQNGSMH